MIRALLILLALASPLHAQEVIAALTQNRVSITANFDGSEITIFGAIKREAPPGDEDLGVIVTVTGPSTPVTVRRKARQAGIWVNADAIHVEAAPSFYAVSTTGPMDQVLDEAEDLHHKISIRRAIRAVGALSEAPDPENFTEALIRIRRGNGLYQINEGSVTLSEATLFQTSIVLPANLTEGDYVARVFLTDGGQVLSQFDSEIAVRKVGLERFLYRLAYDQPVIYGLLSLFIAIAAGWGASAIFRYIQRQA